VTTARASASILAALAAALGCLAPASAEEPALAWKTATESPRPTSPARSLDAPLHASCGVPDAALAAVARRSAERQAAGGASFPADELSFALRAAGDPHVWPRGFSITAPALDEDELARRVKAWAGGWSTLGVRRCGIARGVTPEGAPLLAAVAYDALADMSPLPTTARIGQWLKLEGTMLVPATGAKVVLLGPRGAPKTIVASLTQSSAGAGSTIHSTFSVDQEGAWLVQVLATVSTGPRPVLEAMVYAGTQPPAHFVRERAPGEEAAKGAKDDSDAVLRMVNAARGAEGIAALARDPELDKLALVHSQEMLKAKMVGHDVGGGDPVARLHAAGLTMRMAGENVASSTTLENAHRALWASPSHRGNILLDQFTKIGVAAVRGADGAVWVTEFFGG
jgi:uncharacterized protein YkwD